MHKFPVFVIGRDRLTARCFNQQGSFRIVDDVEQAQIVVWCGGADVSPRLYKSDFHPKTHTDPASDERDLFYWKKAHNTGRLLVGICRGGQFLNVLSGGVMYQHVNNHAIGGTHACLYRHNPKDLAHIRTYQVTSTHHQMMKPSKDGELWGYINRSTFRDMSGETDAPADPKDGPDNEIVFYKKTNALCFQPHPEYGQQETADLFFICIERALKSIARGETGTTGFSQEQIKHIEQIGMPF